MWSCRSWTRCRDYGMRRQLSQIVAVNQSQDKSFIHLALALVLRLGRRVQGIQTTTQNRESPFLWIKTLISNVIFRTDNPNLVIEDGWKESIFIFYYSKYISWTLKPMHSFLISRPCAPRGRKGWNYMNG